MHEFVIHYWYGPNDDDVRLAGEADTIEDARAIAEKCPPDETPLICDRFGIGHPVTA